MAEAGRTMSSTRDRSRCWVFCKTPSNDGEFVDFLSLSVTGVLEDKRLCKRRTKNDSKIQEELVPTWTEKLSCILCPLSISPCFHGFKNWTERTEVLTFEASCCVFLYFSSCIRQLAITDIAVIGDEATSEHTSAPINGVIWDTKSDVV